MMTNKPTYKYPSVRKGGRALPVLLALLAAVLFILSASFIKKEEKDPVLHACTVQNDPSYEGERASVSMNAPFYANTPAFSFDSGSGEYAFFPIYDCSESDPGFVLTGFRTDDEEGYLMMKDLIESLKEGQSGQIVSGRLIRYDMLFEFYKDEAESGLSEYREKLLSLPGVRELSGDGYFRKTELVLLADSREPVCKDECPAAAKIAILMFPVLLMGAAVLITVKRMREE